MDDAKTEAASLFIQDALQRSGDAVFAAMLEAVPDGIVAVDRAGQIVLVNRQTERLFG